MARLDPGITTTPQGTRATVEEFVQRSTVGDQPTSEDRLGFDHYVDSIAEFLLSPDTRPPFNLSIEGEWGSGKSSFMLQLSKKLTGLGARTIWFNPWRHDKEDSLWAAFAVEFLRQNRKQAKLYRFFGDLRLFALRFRWKDGWIDALRFISLILLLVAGATACVLIAAVNRSALLGIVGTVIVDDRLRSWVAAVGGAVGMVTIVLTVLKKLTNSIGNPFSINLRQYVEAPNYESRIAFVERFHEDFGRIVAAYAGKGQKVFVFVDDLDRCDVPKAADLMQALNMMTSGSAPLVFLIGMDREKVAASIAVKHEKLLPYLTRTVSSSVPREGQVGEQSHIDPELGLEYGYEFVEKFIQLPFQVPRPGQENVEHLLDALGAARVSAVVVTSRLWILDRFGLLLSKGLGWIGGQGRRSGTTSVDQSAQQKAGDDAKRRERFDTIRIRTAPDSKAVHEIVLLIAPSLENNPRRIKQFVNLFRLRAYLGDATGLFQESDEGGNVQWTLGKLGKFTAIGLRWPLLLSDLAEDRHLLSRLQRACYGLMLEQSIEEYPQLDRQERERLIRWARRQDLEEFLRLGCVDEFGARMKAGEAEYGLENVDAERILRVWPKVTRSEGAAQSEPGSMAGSSAGTSSATLVSPSGEPPVGSDAWLSTRGLGDSSGDHPLA